MKLFKKLLSYAAAGLVWLDPSLKPPLTKFTDDEERVGGRAAPLKQAQSVIVIADDAPLPPRQESPSLPSEYEELYKLLAAKQPGISEVVAERLFAPFRKPAPPVIEQWLDDLTIQNFLCSLEKSTTSLKVNYIPPQYFQRDDFIARFNPQHSRPFKQKFALSLMAPDLLFWPIREGAHWYLLVMQKNPHNVYHLRCADGFNSYAFHQTIFKKAELLLKALYKDQPFSISKMESYSIPPQPNALSCGEVICSIAKDICEGKAPAIYSPTAQPLPPKVYLPFRLYIARKLVELSTQEFEDGHPSHPSEGPPAAATPVQQNTKIDLT